VKIIFAGGGTGGHLFAAQSIAEELVLRDKNTSIIFVGAARGIEVELVPKMGYPVYFLNVFPLKGLGVFGKLMSSLKILPAFLESLKICFKERPSIVVGVGGYASGPFLAAAKVSSFFLHFKLGILEQNAIPGITNRLLGKFSDFIFLSFPETKKYFNPHKCIWVGNPIRSEILKSSFASLKNKESHIKTLFIFGGSQGAVGLNRLVLAILDKNTSLKERCLNGKIAIIHQTGRLDYETVKKNYDEIGLSGLKNIEIFPFIEDMVSCYQKANLVICRAGASTISELEILGMPAIFVPLPTAADNHQAKNAQVLVDGGGALLWIQGSKDPKEAGDEILEILDQPKKAQEMSQKIRMFARPQAVEQIVAEIQSRMK